MKPLFTSVMTGAKVFVPTLEPVRVNVRLPLNWLIGEPVAMAVGFAAVTVAATVVVKSTLIVKLVFAVKAVM